MPMHRSASTPTLSGADDLEVYVATRALQCKLPHVPEALKNGLLRDIGCQHYYTVIRRPRDGTLTSLDFGPVGGRDIAFTPARESLWQWGRKRLTKAQPCPKGTPGEVREMPLVEMPESCMFVGRTKLSMRDIRSFNSLQNNLYLLHKSDCRHYVNNLVQYATGVEGITRKATREIYTASRPALAWTDRLVLLTHNITDVGQWPRVQRATQTALAVLAALGGRRYAARLASRLQLAARPALQGLPWQQAAAGSIAARQAAGGAAAASASHFTAAGSSTALTRAATSPHPLFSNPRRMRVAGATAAAAAAVVPETSLLGSLGEGLRNTGAVLRAATSRATSAAAAAAAVGTMRLRGTAAAARKPPPVPRAAPSLQPPSRRRQQRRAGLLVLGSTC